ncbi:MAG: hypothetical protein ACO1PZ_05175 [Gammaproteobacteria bacterium]
MKFQAQKFRIAGLALLISSSLLPAVGLGQDNESSVDLGEYKNNSYISLEGTVESVSPNSFVLSYNEDGDDVLVEMDDGDRDADAYRLLPGDRVTVYGVMDRDLFESRKIEASTVYVDKLNTFFSASAVDEEDYLPILTIVTTASGSDMDGDSDASANASAGAAGATPDPILWVQGEVSNVQDGSFDLAMGERDINVTVEGLSDNPLDDEGYRKIEDGDVVSVLGNIDSGFFNDGELVAESVVKVHDSQDN